MQHEHAITYDKQLTMTDLEYVLKKANRLGAAGKALVNVFSETDAEGTHLYFDIVVKK